MKDIFRKNLLNEKIGLIFADAMIYGGVRTV